MSLRDTVSLNDTWTSLRHGGNLLEPDPLPKS